MKRITCLAVAAVLLLPWTLGCGSGQKKGENTETIHAAEPTDKDGKS